MALEYLSFIYTTYFGFILLFLGINGLIFGSFVAAYTYRVSHGLSIAKGRSVCDACKKQITWQDNIPVFSYIFLRGRCRNCKKKISIRYPLIESSFFLGFVLIPLFLNQIAENTTIPNNLFGILYSLVVFGVLSSIFIIDLEAQIIPDELNFFLFILGLVTLFLNSNSIFFVNILSGLSFALFLLLINLLTRGRGMGLGDVKFAIFPGLILGPIIGTIWLFLSFVLGAVVGVFLILIGKAKLGRHIPFGPFLVISLVIVCVFGNIIKVSLFP